MRPDCILMIGFGGPTPGCCTRRASCDCPRGQASGTGEEARCFVAGILGDNPARLKRVDAIAAHYQHLGGYSPYNPLTEAQGAALEAELRRRGHDLPVRCAYRHWSPWPKDVLAQLVTEGRQNVLLQVMSPHQCSVSWDWYIKFAAEQGLELGEQGPRFTGVCAPFWRSPGFITALGERVQSVVADWTTARFQQAALLFSAHAIPEPLEATSPYRTQFEETARLVAERVGHPVHRVAFQSQPSGPGVPWSSPTVEAVLRELAQQGVKDVVLQAAGFLVDHVEILYDLDHEAQDLAKELGINLIRAGSVHDHPAFIAALADAVEEQLARA